MKPITPTPNTPILFDFNLFALAHPQTPEEVLAVAREATAELAQITEQLNRVFREHGAPPLG